MRTPRPLLALLLMTCLGLSACGGGNPTPAPLTRSPAPSSSPSPSPPVKPAALNGTDESAAKALVSYYLEAVSYASNSGDTGPLESAAIQNCKVCTAAVQRVHTIYSGGGRIEGSDYEVVRFSKITADDVGYKVLALVSSTEELVREDSSSEPTSNPASRAIYTFFLTKESGRLLVDNWGFDK